MSRMARIAVAGLSALLTLQLTIVGAMQVIGAEPIRTNVSEMGYPPWFRVLIGLAQIAGVIGLWIPRPHVRFGAAVGLAVVLLGAVGSHIVSGHDVQRTAPAAVTLALLAILAWLRRPAGERDVGGALGTEVT